MKDIDFSKLFPSFPDYTEDMYNGNEPAHKSSIYVDGDVWETQYGRAVTTNRVELIGCGFSIRPYTTIYICWKSLKVVRFSVVAGKSQYFSNESEYPLQSIVMDEKLAEEIINKKLPNCKIWSIIQKRAKELFDFYIQNKYAFLYKKEHEKE